MKHSFAPIALWLGALLLGVAPVLRAQHPNRVSAGELARTLTLEQKAGQLFMGWILSREAGQIDARRTMLERVRQGLFGGVILSTGDMAAARRLIAELQAASRVPLLIAGDFETGLYFRLRDAPRLGNAMLLGATGSVDLARRVGRATGLAGQVLGFHMALAPVLDVNIDPRNPIINVRSLGEDPAAVARLGAALVQGIQEFMLATAKHFPGHGDVDVDSHLDLPVLRADRKRLDRVELLPFRAAIDAGVGAVMTAHLSVPALDDTPRRPATLSAPILTGVLRRALSFRGLIVTDALEMGGITKVMSGEAAAVAALRAGADLLLMPPDPQAARDAVVAAVQSGELPRQRFEEAVAKVLEAKERWLRVGLAADPTIGLPPAEWAAQRALGATVARRGVTLVYDRKDLLPLPAKTRITVLDVVDHDGAVVERFDLALAAAGLVVEQHLRLAPGRAAAKVERELAAAKAAGTLVVGLHLAVRAKAGSVGIPKDLLGVVKVLDEHPRAIAVSFGDPYAVRKFPHVSTYLCAYDRGPVVEHAVAEVVAGRAPVTGRLPVTIPGVAALGEGVSRFGFTPGAGSDAELAAKLTELLTRQVDAKAFPGAVAMVTRRGEVLAHVAVGRRTYAADAPRIERITRFDLASLTKVCATLPALAVLVERGKVRLDDKLATWIPEFHGGAKGEVTLRQVVTHCAGLEPWVGFYKQHRGKPAVVAAAAQHPLTAAPGSKYAYSDLGLILLTAVVEKACGQPLDRFLASEVYPRLGITACYASDGKRVDAAPTEQDPWRGRLVEGEVHDENAFAMGGVSGHAGLFGTAEDVARVGNAFLGGGAGLVRPSQVRQWITRDGAVSGSTRALLWDTFRSGGSGGSKLSERAFGHTGFTGTSVWCDPRGDLCVVLLTNRVHPSRSNQRISRARREVHDLVVDHLAGR
ncbi:MAG: serine hydrolase [Planctomycetes bacterium]|nr:serine hydrolase [Planctomycetota bacterium]